MAVQEWGACKGTRENSRGFTCGLWLLLHSLAARARPEATGGAFWMAAVRCAFIVILPPHAALTGRHTPRTAAAGM